MSHERYPVVDDENRFLYCAERSAIEQGALPHRVVWGMVYSPARGAWLVQWRRPTKFFCPNEWDVSCAGHVNCVDGGPEAYADAYRREMSEELGLCTRFVAPEEWGRIHPQDLVHSPLSMDIGPSKEYHLYPTPGGQRVWAKEHARLFVSLYDGLVALGPAAEPQAIAWLTAQQIVDELIAPGRATLALAMMLERCGAFIRDMLGIDAGAAADEGP
jgi:hypothetical protein